MDHDVQDGTLAAILQALSKLDVDVLAEEFTAQDGSSDANSYSYVYVRVTYGGVAVAGLDEANFELTKIRSDEPCNLAIDDVFTTASGTYTLRVSPQDDCAWASGVHVANVLVTAGSRLGSALVAWTVDMDQPVGESSSATVTSQPEGTPVGSGVLPIEP